MDRPLSANAFDTFGTNSEIGMSAAIDQLASEDNIPANDFIASTKTWHDILRFLEGRGRKNGDMRRMANQISVGKRSLALEVVDTAISRQTHDRVYGAAIMHYIGKHLRNPVALARLFDICVKSGVKAHDASAIIIKQDHAKADILWKADSFFYIYQQQNSCRKDDDRINHAPLSEMSRRLIQPVVLAGFKTADKRDPYRYRSLVKREQGASLSAPDESPKKRTNDDAPPTEPKKRQRCALLARIT